MIDYLSQAAMSNLCLSLGLAMVAWAVDRTGKWPHVAHVLWLLVLAKLVTPPVLSVPAVAGPDLLAGSRETLAERLAMGPMAAGLAASDPDAVAIGRGAGGIIAAARPSELEAMGFGVILLWGTGGALVLASLAREPRKYANALMTAVELLACPAIRPPAMASGMNSGGFLERRLNMILAKQPLSKCPRCVNTLLLCACLVLPLGGTHARDADRGNDLDVGRIGAPETGTWRAGSDTADAVTGNIRVTGSSIAFANGSSISIRPAYPGARNVFAVEPAVNPVMLNGNRLCGSPVTYVTLLTYHAFALAVHMHDGVHPPDEPTPANVGDIARRGKCASYYYHLVP